MEPDPGVEPPRTAIAQEEVRDPQLFDHLERSAHGALGVIAARLRVAEIGQDAVAVIIADKASKSLHDVERELSVPALHGHQFFGVEFLC